ncbi:MAG: hypothetical protein OXE95_11120 [Chloroflexi bacterium]|nr:hypothetical protein [Chloroflexota bacterium]MCY4248109.1 hypothetical protein [Chloroflexota bacterium]
MKTIWDIAWRRFSENSAIVAEMNGRFIATLFYCTILVPFGLLSALFMDPLRIKGGAVRWQEREPIPTDIDSARQQG